MRPQWALLVRGLATGLLALAGAGSAQVATERPSVANSFRLGVGGAEARAADLITSTGGGVTLPNGSIAISDGMGAGAGAIQLDARRSTVATAAAAAADVAAAGSAVARRASLAINDTTALGDAGGLSADRLAIRAAVPPVRPPLIEIVRSNPFSYTPSIDEPVTGSGNDSLWTGVGIGADDGAATGTGEEPQPADPVP